MVWQETVNLPTFVTIGSIPIISTKVFMFIGSIMNYLIVFFLVFLTDILYCFYLKAVNQDKHLLASVWSTAVTWTASIAAINYIEDHSMLYASLTGAFCGTYFAMKFNKKINQLF